MRVEVELCDCCGKDITDLNIVYGRFVFHTGFGKMHEWILCCDCALKVDHAIVSNFESRVPMNFKNRIRFLLNKPLVNSEV